jgi:HK97 family phage portal protein
MSRIRSGIREMRSRFINWLDKDTGLPYSPGYFPVSSGVAVTQESAMRVTAVFACVRILSWTLASLPLHVYRRLEPRGKERATTHPLYRLLHGHPNPEQTIFQFCSLLAAHECLWGNGYAEIEFDHHGRIVALWPIPAWRCEPRRAAETRALFYEVTLPDGKLKKLADYQVYHVKGLSLDGDSGLSPIAMAREAIGLSVAAEKFGASFFGNGLNAGGVIEHPKSLSTEVHKRLKEDLNEKHEGLGKAHRLMFLEEGMKYVKVGINPDEAQFLDTRKFQVADIARLYGIPPHMIGDTEKSTSWGTGIEQQGIGFVVHTMRPYLVAWEQEMALKLLDSRDQDTYYTKFAVDGLLRGDTASRYSAYATGRQWGWLSVNDIREYEDMNPIEGGDIYVQPLNMQDVALPIKDPAAPPADDPAPKRDLEPVIQDAAARILRREEADVMRMARKLEREAFQSWLPGFYLEHKEYIAKQLEPVARVSGFADELGGLADQITAESQAEILRLAPSGPDGLQEYFNSNREAGIAMITGLLTGGTE